MLKAHEERLLAREDELLTAPSVVHALQQQKVQRSSIPAEEVAAQRRERQEAYRALMQHKTEEKRQSLHTLYVNAREFILTEQELEARIAKVFDADFYQTNADRGVWDEQGVPETVGWLIDRENRIGGESAIEMTSNAEIAKKRIQRIAEELTGGKI